MVAGAAEMPVPGGALLFPVRRADRTVHVEDDVLQPRPVEEAVDPLAAQIGERGAVALRRQTLGLEPAHLGCGCRLAIDCAVANDLPHHRVMGQPLGVVDVLVAREPPVGGLPKKARSSGERGSPRSGCRPALCSPDRTDRAHHRVPARSTGRRPN